jgi:beta-galactosidase GanA
MKRFPKPFCQAALFSGRRVFLAGVLCALCSSFMLSASAQGAQPIPRIDHTGTSYHLIVDGHPFLMLGGQAHNSSATNPEDLIPVWKTLEALHANTAEVPIYWELIEPTPGHFDFHTVDQTIAGARKHGLRLVLLWFASWKNGEMHYTPEWVKKDTAKFRRVRGFDGHEMEILSPLCDACRDADAKAFGAVMEHIRKFDETERTVIMMQVENETGLLGTDRDYSDEATRQFQASVLAELREDLDRNRENLSASMKAAWTSSQGSDKNGTWTELFGELAPEAFSAWHIARYVDAVTAAGKRAYPLPMYVNNWLINPGNERAGRWPSGGPTEHVLDIWKAGAPHIDLLAPDVYLPDFSSTCVAFTRPDNPLFVPETRSSDHFAAYAFSTLAEFNGMGFSPFGIDHLMENTAVIPQASELEDSYRVLNPLLPLIAKLQYTGKMHAIVQDEKGDQVIRVGKNLAAVVSFTRPYNLEGARGRGLILELAPDEYVVAGAGFRVDFRELEGPPREANFLTLEEGKFDGDQWVTARRLNGDELHVRFGEKARILRVRLSRN